MARKSPAEKLDQMNRFIRAWETHAADDTLFGLTLPQFRNVLQMSFDTRERIAHLNSELTVAIRRRNDADRQSMRIMRGVAYAVRGNPDHGPDGLLYDALGYVPDRARRKRRRKAK